MPHDLRSEHKEEIIKKRLHHFFKVRFGNYATGFKNVRKKGIIFTVLGIILLAIITYLFSLKTFSGIIPFIFIVAEPAGWFLIWMGLDNMFFTSKPKKPDLDFYKKLSEAEIHFHSTPESNSF